MTVDRDYTDLKLIRGTLVTPLRIAFVVFLVGMGIRLYGISQTRPGIYNEPLWDDAYYYFTLGEHVASGQGMKSDDAHLDWSMMEYILFAGLLIGIADQLIRLVRLVRRGYCVPGQL